MLRQVIFWLHLLSGVVAGLIIGVMCFTGVVLAFEKQIVAFAERDVRRLEPPSANAPRKPLDELVAKARSAFKNVPPQPSVTVSTDPREAVVISVGRNRNLYGNPYTGAVVEPVSTRTHDFMHWMEDWHRWLAFGGDQRALGKGVTGACNFAFTVLGLTGLVIWWPRRWSWKALRPSVWFTGASGKARDWNWHNVIGIWCLPVLLVLSVSGVVISYRWATDAVYRLAGDVPPSSGGPAASAVEVAKPAADAKPLTYDALLAVAQAQKPDYQSISLRFGGPPPRGQGGGAPAPGAGKPQPVTAAIRAPGNWPLFTTPTWQLDPYTGAVLKAESFADLNPGRKARSWLRFLHTGEALGLVGQFVAGVASLGGLVLVWTGYALAWRRFRAWRNGPDAPTA
ncbi:MAG: PepSY domain-containing protein [Verrucomicrobia bacterium]|nr:PepSY domain-containing protein [Verrucomicrobiota bacterium]